MDFIKRNYEKIILSLVLLGLVGVLAFMPVMIFYDQERTKEYLIPFINPKVDPLRPLDLSRPQAVLDRLQTPAQLDFSTTNKLFNPLPWQKRLDGTLVPVKIGLIGQEAVVVTKITPLSLILTLDAIETNEFGARYVISMEREAAVLPAQRGKRQHYASVGEKVGEKNEAFTITDVSGSPGNPAQLKLILQLTDTGEKVTLSKDKPFRRTDGYSVDLKYDPEGKKWQGQRKDADLRFAGDDNIIVAINQDSVILRARSNDKKTTLTYSPNP